MKNLSSFLAWRIIGNNKTHNNAYHMTLLCFVGIFIGSFSLALITAIMYGFEQAIEEKMQGVHADLIVDTRKIAVNFSALNKKLLDEFPSIAACSPQITKHALIQSSTHHAAPSVVMLKGIKPLYESHTSTLFDKLEHHDPEETLASRLPHNGVLIGKECAKQNNLSLGDSLELIFINNQTVQKNKITVDSHYVTVTGIFSTGIDEYDTHVLYCSLSTLKSMFSEINPETIALKLVSKHDATSLKNTLRKRFGLPVYSWKDLYPSLVSAQTLETYVAFIIISLIVAVASINIISLLYLYITQRKTDIALLKALGIPDKLITRIFFIIGASISSAATTAGIACAVFASFVIKKVPFITLPDSYYVTHLPVAMEWHIIIAVLCTVMLFSLSATWYAVQQIKKINVSSVLRLEG